MELDKLEMIEVNARIKLWLTDTEGTVLMGEGRARLLEHIEEHGSISAAAREMNMSYRTAWHLVKSMNSKLPANVVITKTGGESGGRAEVTPMGKALAKEFREIKNLAKSNLQTRCERFSEILEGREYQSG